VQDLVSYPVLLLVNVLKGENKNTEEEIKGSTALQQ